MEAGGISYGSMRGLYLSTRFLRKGLNVEFIGEILELDLCMELFVSVPRVMIKVREKYLFVWLLL